MVQISQVSTRAPPNNEEPFLSHSCGSRVSISPSYFHTVSIILTLWTNSATALALPTTNSNASTIQRRDDPWYWWEHQKQPPKDEHQVSPPVNGQNPKNGPGRGKNGPDSVKKKNPGKRDSTAPEDLQTRAIDPSKGGSFIGGLPHRHDDCPDCFNGEKVSKKPQSQSQKKGSKPHVRREDP